MSKLNRDKNVATKQKDRLGAKQVKTSLIGRFKAYLHHHKVSLSVSFAKLYSSPLQTLLTALVVAIALALPATLLIALQNAQQVGENLNTKPQLSIYLDKRAKEQAVTQFVESLNANTKISKVVYKSAEQALSDFKQTSGFGDVLESLDDNPLPPTVIIDPAAGFLTPNDLTLLSDQLRSNPLVEDVIFDMGWVRRLIDIMLLIETVIIALAGLLGLGILLAIGNTIRLEIENRRAEILVSKLVGGTNAFVRRPFLYTGILYGIAGAIIAAVIVSITLMVIDNPVARLAQSYQSGFTLEGLGLSGWCGLVCIGAILGLLGAWLAVSREISKIEP